MMYRSLCPMCVHFHSEDDPEVDSGLVTCAAFPAGIPDEVLREGFDHRNPHEADNGVTFEPRPNVTEEQIERVVNPPMERNPKNW